MASDYFDEHSAERYERLEFDFPDKGLAGRTIVLAGGAGGLGAATAVLLAREGARLIVGGRVRSERANRLCAALEGQGSFVAADITTTEGRAALLDAADSTYGLVVFVGDPARGADEATLRQSMEINYLAPILLAREAADRMKAAVEPGAIVLFSSMQGGYPFEGSTAYGSAKAALAHAARVLAKEVGSAANIRVNVVAPGATMAGMAQSSLRSGKYDPFVEKGVIPRFGRAEDVARTVRFLLEPDNYITGQVITVDGGMTLRRDQH
jgi:NAD(P)-dependent dehydrogenase (short-subunit alcohol dehydrogenase family)